MSPMDAFVGGLLLGAGLGSLLTWGPALREGMRRANERWIGRRTA